MKKFKIAEKIDVTTGNKIKAQALILTQETDSEEIRRVFQLMWERAKLLKPKVMFDPLNLFENLGMREDDAN